MEFTRWGAKPRSARADKSLPQDLIALVGPRILERDTDLNPLLPVRVDRVASDARHRRHEEILAVGGKVALSDGRRIKLEALHHELADRHHLWVIALRLGELASLENLEGRAVDLEGLGERIAEVRRFAGRLPECLEPSGYRVLGFWDIAPGLGVSAVAGLNGSPGESSEGGLVGGGAPGAGFATQHERSQLPPELAELDDRAIGIIGVIFEAAEVVV